ncbi:MAG: autotransporter domain-containing protein [Alphaproteobacteria bacterium]|nr:autotransporter domain-containing protein [Alphaproteobacteria bacterium]
MGMVRLIPAIGGSLVAGLALSSQALPAPLDPAVNAAGAAAQQLPDTGTVSLDDGSLVDFVSQSGDAATQVLTGTIDNAGTGTVSDFTCTVDAANATVTGSPACASIIGGAATGGLPLSALTDRIVGDRVGAAVEFSGDARLHQLDGEIGRHLDSLAQGIAVENSDEAGAGAAPPVPQIGTWGFVTGGFLDDDRFGRNSHGRNVVATVGLDYRMGRTVIGAFGGYTRTDVHLVSLDATYASDGYLVGGYGVVSLDDTFSLQAFGGYSRAWADFDRQVAGQAAAADFTESGWFAGAALNATWRFDSVALTGSAGVLYGDWNASSYTDTLGNSFSANGGNGTALKLGSVLTFGVGRAHFQPYLLVNYLHQISRRAPDTGRDTVIAGGGINLVNTASWTVAVEGTATLLQRQRQAYTASLKVRLHL